MWDELQKGVSNRLMTNANLVTLIGDRYYPTYIPTDIIFPYISSDEETPSEGWSTLGQKYKGELIFFPFKIWCDLRNGGPKTVNAIGKEIKTLFDWDMGGLTVSGFNVEGVRRTFDTNTLKSRDQDDLFFRVMRYEIRLREVD